MGFWGTVGDLAYKGIKKAGEKAAESMDKYDTSYDRYSSRLYGKFVNPLIYKV